MIVRLLGALVYAILFPLRALRRRRASPPGGYVRLVLKGRLAEFAPRRRRLLSWFRPAPPTMAAVRDLTELVSRDPRIEGLLVEVRAVGGGHAMMASLREAIASVRAAGKDVIAYLPSGGDTDVLYVASAARVILAAPTTFIAPLGYAMRRPYFHRALDRHGVEPEVFARGVYKSAAEFLQRDDMSEPEKEQLGALLDVLHERLVDALATGRGVDRSAVVRWIDEGPYIAEEAARLGIVDAAAYEDEIDRYGLSSRLSPSSSSPGDSRGGALTTVPAVRYLKAHRALARPLGRGGVIGVVEVHGPILPPSRFDLSNVVNEAAVVSALRMARRSRAVQGVILHIDSPGGSATASDRIHHEVARLAQRKPVVAYLSNIAASGGYYVASAAHAIVAQPETITGSIGVVSARLVLGSFLDRLGVSTDLVKRGAHADLFSPTRPLDASERAAFERAMDAIYGAFLRVVAEGRHRPVSEIEPLAGGRVYSGAAAHARGLVDELGGFDRALRLVRDRVGGPRAADLRPRVLRAARFIAPEPAPPAAAELAQSLGLMELLERVAIATALGREPVLLYWGGYC